MRISKKRYFKRSRKAHQRMITDKARKAKQLAQRPPMHRVDKKERIHAIFNSGRTNQRALFLDLDGTLIEYGMPTRSHKKPPFRPCFDHFVTEMSKHADLFIFLATNPVRLDNVKNKYLKDKFCGYLDQRFLSGRKKNLNYLRKSTQQF